MSDDKPSRSPGGSDILRHEARAREFEPPAASTGTEEIEQHFARVFGEPQSVFHEIVSDIVHIDVHIIPPRPVRDHWTLFTTGMSDLPMNVPKHIEGAEQFAFAELMLMLPASWEVGSDVERWYWPLRWLKQLARLPHEYNTWLGALHTIPNGDPPKPFSPETNLCCWLLLPPVGVDEADQTITLKDGRVVNIYCLLALHREEVSLKLNKGGEALIEALDAAGVSEVLQIDRPPAVRKKLFGLF
ncbi:MAG: suppressor of fused domain protein [Polyangiaceae bacterium]|nr:suppressor of fused domain protein [Polyangiaceae bacterium]